MTANYLITGGAGFIGSNYVARLLANGKNVTIYDNLSRAGSVRNIQWLESKFGKKSFELIKGDIRDFDLLHKSLNNKEIVVHLAAQVAVTTSVENPREDFAINALGTFNLLEAIRVQEKKPIVIYASTNKVYGGMEDVKVVEEKTRYAYADFPLGINETYPLDFHSPYGCSKGCGDQYVRDYCRIYDIPTIVFRQSCIYGPRQFGIEDQGWLAWFVIAAKQGRKITIYGDGKQVRDVLFIDDLINAYENAIDNINTTAGNVYNIGGGIDNTISVWVEFGPMLEKKLGKNIDIARSYWRPGDQKIYISDISKAIKDLNWKPKVSVDKGISELTKWVTQMDEETDR